MKFEKFEIKNYKGIKDLTLDFTKSPSVKVFTLIGLNESGKTSILEAITLFQEGVMKDSIHKLIPKGEKFSFNGSISVKATLAFDDEDFFKLTSFSNELGLNLISYPKKVTINRDYQFENSNYIGMTNYWAYFPIVCKKRSKKKYTLTKEVDEVNWTNSVDFIELNLMPKIIYFPNFLFDFPEKIYLTKEEGESNENIRYRDIIQDILYSIKPNLTIEEHILQRLEKKKGSNREALEHTLSLLSGKVSQTVFKAWERLFSSGSKQIEITPGEEINPATQTIRYFLEFKLKEGPNRFYIHERSLGFKWFFSFLLFTEFRKNRITDTGEILFLLDEPASNLHSTAQKKLLETFKDLVSKSILIYTTHSHHLINPEWLLGAYIIRNKALNYEDEFLYDPNQTDIEATLYKRFITQYPDQQDYFQPILDTLEVQPGLLEKIPNIIILEGKNDYYTFKYISKVLFGKNFDKYNFFPGVGADTKERIIALYTAWERPFIVLLDGDQAGVRAKQRYLTTFGKEIENKVFTLADISDKFNKATSEDLFSENEKIIITQKFDMDSSKYEKSKFNLALQILLVSNEKIKLSNETLENFKIVLEFLKTKIPS